MASDPLIPNGDVDSSNTFNLAFGGPGTYADIDDDPTSPNTADGIYFSGEEAIQTVNLSTLIGVNSVSALKVQVYGVYNDWGGGGGDFNVQLSYDGFSTFVGEDALLMSGGNSGLEGVYEKTFSSLSLNQSNTDALRLRIIFTDIDLVGNDGYIYAARVIATYTQSAATAYTMTGPAACVVGIASGDFTFTLNGTHAGNTITPSDGGAGGTFTPSTVNLSTGTPSATVTYTAASSGAKTISATDSGGLTDPANIALTAYTAPGGVTTGLIRWWHADDLSGSNGANVDTWTDRVKGAAVSASSTNRPTFQNTAFNGTSKCLVFDGSNDYMQGDTAGGLTGAFMVVTSADVTSGWLFGQGSTPSTRQAIHIGHRSSTQVSNAMYGDDEDHTIAAATGVKVNSYRAKTSPFAGEIRINGVSAGTKTFGGVFTGNTFQRIGTAPVSFDTWANGKLRQVIAYNGDVSDGDRTTIENAVMTDAGLISGGPTAQQKGASVAAYGSW